MKTLRRSVLSLVVAFLIAFAATVNVYAAFVYVDESSPQFNGGGLWTVWNCYQSSAGCYNGNAKYSWSGYNADGQWNFTNRSTFEAWIPKPFANNSYGTVRYNITGDDVESVIVNQTNHKLNWVYLGWNVPARYVYMHAQCVYGFPCGNGPVLYDAVRSNQ